MDVFYEDSKRHNPKGRGESMSMDKCPDCGKRVCDVSFYNGVDEFGEPTGKRARKKDDIQCPYCDKIRKLGEWK